MLVRRGTGHLRHGPDGGRVLKGVDMSGRKNVLLSLAMVAALVGPLAAQETQKQEARQKPVATAKHTARRTASRRAMYPRLVQERPGLLEQAAVKPDEATHTALQGMEGARVVARRLVKRGDDLVYVITVHPKGAKTSKHVYVDAKTGSVLQTMPVRAKARAKPKG